MNAAKWVLIDQSAGATTKDGARLSPTVLAHIAKAVSSQVNGEFANEWGTNLFANDNKGWLHAMEMCDAVEIQTYEKTCGDGTVVRVSNWLLRAWFIPGANGPYDYMSQAKLPGAVNGPAHPNRGGSANRFVMPT